MDIARTEPNGGDTPQKSPNADTEKGHANELSEPPHVESKPTSAFKSLGWLDRYLAVWILLAMIVGVLLGNFVPEVGPSLDKGKFVGVSIPIGKIFCAPKRVLMWLNVGSRLTVSI